MAEPQLENGHIRIANDLWNEILRRNFSKRQLNLILFIWRLSYGTGQKDCVIPNFTHFEIAGMYKQDVKKELTFLVDCAVLDWEQETMVFSINKDYHHWQITPNKKWNNDLFTQLIHTNLQRKRQKNATNSTSQTKKRHAPKNHKVGKLLTMQKAIGK
ncbi:replication protein [Gracilibacillus caseinilyticus]|uniref:Replication protein n=1 Tax=Gracilibacillus caseinilyticus TaxID=2932256 RepID=A0ABY4EZD4_9BACI|nr:replication protein [Gracilibacillus caseinilyticus]UOQ49633.1 replication protein [Gracilibacillus caseinilyticus]